MGMGKRQCSVYYIHIAYSTDSGIVLNTESTKMRPSVGSCSFQARGTMSEVALHRQDGS